MSEVSEAPRRWDDRPPARTDDRWLPAVSLVATIGANVLIGWVALFGIVITATVVWVRVLGHEDHFLKDNAGLATVLGTVSLALVLALFGLANYFLSRRSPIRGWRYWLLASALALLPLLWLLVVHRS